MSLHISRRVQADSLVTFPDLPIKLRHLGVVFATNPVQNGVTAAVTFPTRHQTKGFGLHDDCVKADVRESSRNVPDPGARLQVRH